MANLCSASAWCPSHLVALVNREGEGKPKGCRANDTNVASFVIRPNINNNDPETWEFGKHLKLKVELKINSKRLNVSQCSISRQYVTPQCDMALAKKVQSHGFHRQWGLGTHQEEELHWPLHQRWALYFCWDSVPHRINGKMTAWDNVR